MSREVAQIGLGIVGGVIGSTFGMPGLGFAIGSTLGGVLVPQRLPDIEGPQLSDLGVSTAGYGTKIAVIEGTLRWPAELFYATDRRKRQHREEVEGGKGGSSQVRITYTYDMDGAWRFCEGEVAALTRVFAYGKLLFDQSIDASLNTRIAGSTRFKSLTFYPGNDTQLPDPTIEAGVGAGNAPAWRGDAYMVLDTLQLADFNNSPPAMSAVVTSTTAPAALAVKLTSDTYDADTDAHGYLRVNPTTLESIVFGVTTPSGGTSDLTNRYIDANGVASSYGANKDAGTIYASILNNFGSIFWQGGDYSAELLDSNVIFVGVVSSENRIIFGGYSTSTLKPWIYEPRKNFQRLMQPVDPTLVTTITGTLGAVPIAIYQNHLYAQVFKVSAQGYAFVRYDINTELHSVELLAAASGFWWQNTFYGCDETGFFLATLLDAGAGESLLHVFAHGEDTPTTYTVPSRAMFSSGGNYNIYKTVWRENNDFYFGGVSLHKYDSIVDTVANLGSTGLIDGVMSSWRSGVITGVGVVDSINHTYQKIWSVVGLAAGAAPSLQSVITNICTRQSEDFTDPPLTAADLSFALTGAPTVTGYGYTQATRRACLEPLLLAYNVGMVESEGKLKFKTLTGAVDFLDIDPDDLGAHPKGSAAPDNPLPITVIDDKQLPLRVEVSYIDASRNYDWNVQVAQRRQTATSAEQVLQIRLPLVLTADQAKQIAEIQLQRAWVHRTHYGPFSLPALKYAKIEPLDVVQVTYRGILHTILIEVKDESGGIATFTGVADAAAAYISIATGVTSQAPVVSSIPLPGPTVLELIDSVTLRNSDAGTGFYAAVDGPSSDWTGAVLYKAVDNGETYNEVTAFTSEAAMGVATNALGNVASPNCFDKRNTLTVRLMGDAALTSAVDTEALCNGANPFLLGNNEKGWEVGQFRDVVDNGDGTWTLSFLLRGLRGTEHLTGIHAAGDTFILLSTAGMKFVEMSTAERGILREYLGASIGGNINDVDQDEFTWAGESLKPLSVGYVRGKRDGSGNLTTTWIPRKRIHQSWRGGVPYANDENGVVQFQFDVMNGAAVLNTYTVDDATQWVYSSAEQTADGVPNPNAINLKMYHMSGNVSGLRGHVMEVTV